jgi:hypothetical protein
VVLGEMLVIQGIKVMMVIMEQVARVVPEVN